MIITIIKMKIVFIINTTIVIFKAFSHLIRANIIDIFEKYDI